MIKKPTNFCPINDNGKLVKTRHYICSRNANIIVVQALEKLKELE